MTDFLYLSGKDLAGLADSKEYVDVVRDGFQYRGEGSPAMAPSRLSGDNTTVTTYTTIFPEWGVMGGYMYAVGDDVWYTTPLFDPETGELLAILDGAVWNPYKTGAVAAVGTDELAREDAQTVGVVGSAQIARSSVELIDHVRDLEYLKVHSPTKESRESFATDVEEQLGFDAEAVGSSEQAVSNVDILVVATDAPEPVIDGENVSDGTHINAMGAAHPKREIDVATFEKVSKYVPDIRERVFGNSVQTRFRAAAGFLAAFDQQAVSENTLHGELGQVVAGNIPGRTSEGEITLVDSVGTAIETVSTAYMLYEKAKEQNLGTELEIVPRHESDGLV